MIPNKIRNFKPIFLAVAVAAMLSGCANGEKSHSDAATFDAPVDAKSGNVVALWVEYREGLDHPDPAVKLADGDVPVLVTEPLGCYMSWNEDEQLFLVYDNKAKRVFKSVDFDAFIDHLSHLPRGSAIQRFDTCTVSRTWAMPDDAWDRLHATMKERDLSWAKSKVNETNREIICYCESEGFRFPTPAPAPGNRSAAKPVTAR